MIVDELNESPSAGSATVVPQGRKIAIFVDDLSATGVVRNAISIANRLRSEGWDACIVASRAEGPFKSSIANGVAVQQLVDNPSSRLSRRSRLFRSLRRYRRFLKSFRPDVLLSAGNHGHLPTVLASMGVAGCRTVYRISNDIEHRRQGKPDRSLAGLARRLQLRLVSGCADLIVIVSRHLQGEPVIASALSSGRATVIQNGVDLRAVQEWAGEECHHPWLAQAAEQPVALGIGRLVRQKNFGTLLRAVAIARRTKPLRLLLIGSGPLQKELEQEAERLGIGDSVAIIPPTANPMPYMARAAVVVLASWWEGSSNVLFEALACGTPVVASRTAGDAETVLAFGRYGLLVDPDDPEGMAEAILVQTSSRAQFPGDRALNFSRDNMLQSYGDVIRDLANA
jgi:glycosyltransferase involved in cell wall biosynthesis